MRRSEKSNRLVASLFTMASVAVVVVALYWAKPVLVPLLLAGLLSFLLAPICDRLERWYMPRVVAVLLTAFLAFSVLGLLAAIVATQVTDVGRNLPAYQTNLAEKAEVLNDSLGALLQKMSKTSQEIERWSKARDESPEKPFPVRIVSPPANPLQIVATLFGTLMEVGSTAGIVIVFVIFFLARREDLRDRFIRLVCNGRLTVTTRAIDDAATRVSRFLATQLLLNAIFGVAAGIGLYFIGVPNAILWGLLSTALRFLPYIGPILAAATPVLLSLAVSPGWWVPLLTIALFLALEAILSNILEPLLYGARVGVSPVAVLGAAVFWGWLWGGIGLLLATPLTVCLVVLGKYVPQLEFLSVLLGDEPVFDEKTRVYQRLLADDPEEATELIEAHRERTSLAELYDELLLPLLGLIEIDHRRGELDEFQHQAVCQTLRDLLDELGEAECDETPAGPAEQRFCLPSGQSLRVLCLPARDEADELAGRMLMHLLECSGYQVELALATALSGEMVSLVEENQADLVCVSAVPPSAVTHARYLCKRLQARYPELNLLIGLWNTHADLSKARARLNCGATGRVVTTLQEMREQIRTLAPLLLEKRSMAEV